MLTIYLKAVLAAFRQTMGDLWGVLWRPRHTLQEIYERGTWFVSLVLLLLVGYVFRFLFLFGFLVVLSIAIKAYAKTGRWYSFLRITGYCMLPMILLAFLLLLNILQRLVQFLPDPCAFISFWSILSLFLFLTLRLLTIMLNIIYPAMKSWQRLVTLLAAFLGGSVIAGVCVSVLNMLYILWKG